MLFLRGRMLRVATLSAAMKQQNQGVLLMGNVMKREIEIVR